MVWTDRHGKSGSRIKAHVAPHIRRNAFPPIAQPTIDSATGAESGGRDSHGSGGSTGQTKVAASSCGWYARSVYDCVEAGGNPP